MGGMRGNTTLKGITRLDLNVECALVTVDFIVFLFLFLLFKYALKYTGIESI